MSVSSTMFKVQEIPIKGRGLVATCAILRGTRILDEKPFIITTNNNGSTSAREACEKLYLSLSQAKRAQFDALFNAFPDMGKRGVFHTNGQETEGGGIALCETVLLINHSCLPNAHLSWNDRTRFFAVQALLDILAGDEIVISYIPNPYQTEFPAVSSRSGWTKSSTASAQPAASLRTSWNPHDKGRQSISKAQDLAFLLPPRDPEAVCQLITKQIMPALAKEGGWEGIKTVICHAYFCCAHWGAWRNASAFAKAAKEWKMIAHGGDSVENIAMAVVEKQPSLHREWMKYRVRIMKVQSIPSFKELLASVDTPDEFSLTPPPSPAPLYPPFSATASSPPTQAGSSNMSAGQNKSAKAKAKKEAANAHSGGLEDLLANIALGSDVE